MKVRIQIARSTREYADVIVEAPSVEAAQSYVEALQKDGDSQAYCDMVNGASWNSGSDTFDEEVLDAEEFTDDGDEADVIAAAGTTCEECGAFIPEADSGGRGIFDEAHKTSCSLHPSAIAEQTEYQREMDRDYPVPPGLQRRPGVEAGCGKADCTACYEPSRTKP